MPVNPKWIVSLKGKDYPTWPGILDAAWDEGLLKIEVTMLQAPAEENAWTAIAQARAEFKDGRVFQEIGDCNAKNTSPQIATAAPRMAATRAKGRALRDALNIGETMLEELPEESQTPTPYASQAIRDPNKNGRKAPAPAPPAKAVTTQAGPRPPRFAHLDRAASIQEWGRWKARAKSCELTKEAFQQRGIVWNLTQDMDEAVIGAYLEMLAPWVEEEETRLGKRAPAPVSASVAGDAEYRAKQDALHLEHAQREWQSQVNRAHALGAGELAEDIAPGLDFGSVDSLRDATGSLKVLLDRMEEAPAGVERELQTAA
jgi:hypothetical protein